MLTPNPYRGNFDSIFRGTGRGGDGYESNFKKQEVDNENRDKIRRAYSQMINALNNDEVPFDKYIDTEPLKISEKQIYELKDSKAMAELWQQKTKLKKARKEAGVRQKKHSILSEMTGREITSKEQAREAEKGLSSREQKHLLNELFREVELPPEINPPKEEEEEDKLDKELNKIEEETDEGLNETEEAEITKQASEAWNDIRENLK